MSYRLSVVKFILRGKPKNLEKARKVFKNYWEISYPEEMPKFSESEHNFGWLFVAEIENLHGNNLTQGLIRRYGSNPKTLELKVVISRDGTVIGSCYDTKEQVIQRQTEVWERKAKDSKGLDI